MAFTRYVCSYWTGPVRILTIAGQNAIARGGVSVREPYVLKDEKGEVVLATIKTVCSAVCMLYACYSLHWCLAVR